MDYSYLLHAKKYSEKDLLAFGFEKEKDGFHFTKKVSSYEIHIHIDCDVFDVWVEDLDFNERCKEFEAINSRMPHIIQLQEEVEEIVQTVYKNCFNNSSFVPTIMQIAHDLFQTEPEFPFRDSTAIGLYTKEKHKWYGLIMSITYKQLGLPSSQKIDVINIKCTNETIKKYIDYVTFFPAYHMNKKHWMSIILSDSLDYELITKLLKESYLLANK